ncbi:MAG: thiamine-phosphate kinase [Actinomycetota bacterium]|nr:thiamine-phosphate kinase [Actinomycetota bacterium]
MNPQQRSVSELGEIALIRRITERIGRSPDGETWSGDDCAVLDVDDRRLLVTTDLLVEGVDFTLEHFAPDAIGWKAIAVNLSDIAAMGGIPRYAVAAMSLRPECEVATVDEILEGMLAATERWGVALVGGDLTRADEIAISVTLLGAPAAERAILRSTAGPGDAICVTGTLGGAAGGLIEMKRGYRESRGPGGLRDRQQRPQPRVAEGQRLAELGVSSMIDISDGLAVDLEHLMVASGTGCEVDPSAIPVDPQLEALRGATGDPVDSLELAITGGEDFELLFTVAAERVDDVRDGVAELGTAVTHIGAVTEGARRLGDRPLEEWRRRGWDHLLDR